MKKINYIKFIIDLAMLITFTLFFNKMVLGMALHEIIGIAIGGVVLIHCGLNFRWIKAITLKLFSKDIKLRTRIVYILDVALLIDILAIIISGLSISRVVCPWLRLSWLPNLKGVHMFASYLILMIIGIHLGLHWKWVMNTFKNIFNIKESMVLTYIARVLVIMILAFGIYSFTSTNYLSRLSIISMNKEGMKPNLEFNKDEENIEFKQDNDEVNDNNDLSSDTDKKENSKDNFEGEREKNYSNEEGMRGERPKDFNYDKRNQNREEFNGKSAESNLNMKGNSTSNIFNVITSYLGVISLFTIIVYYLEKIIKKSAFKRKS